MMLKVFECLRYLNRKIRLINRKGDGYITNVAFRATPTLDPPMNGSFHKIKHSKGVRNEGTVLG